MPPLRRLSTTLCASLLIGGRAIATQPGEAPWRPPLFHGNWCGAGDSDRAAPIDALDAACRAHDLCYEKLGRNACSCDRAFLRATAGLIRSPRTKESVRSKAATANSLFSAAPCAEPTGSGQSAKKR